MCSNAIPPKRRLLQHTSAQLHAERDNDVAKTGVDRLSGMTRQATLNQIRAARRFASLKCARSRVTTNFLQHQQKLASMVAKRRITVNGSEAHDQQALDYALYHLRIMTPARRACGSICGKGLTGEGYKGHVFWDANYFLLPFHLFSDPTVARSLLRYPLWHNLQARRRKRDATAGRARYFRGKARAAAQKRRGICRH